MQPSIHPTDARGSGGLESAAGRRRHRDAECEMAHLKRQIDWFRPQIFGHKSERRIVPVDTGQMSLGEGLTSPETGSPPPTPTQPVAAHHRRRVAQNPGTGPGRCRSSMPTGCPWRSLPLASPEAEALAPEEFEVTDTKETFRLAQRLGSYVVIKYVWPLIKRRADGALCCPAAPVGVIEGSRAGELPCGPAHRQVRLPPALVPSTPAPHGCRLSVEPPVAGPGWGPPRRHRAEPDRHLPPAGGSIPTTTWSMCCSGSRPTRRLLSGN